MPLFEEINLDTIHDGDEIFINARQLAWHLSGSMRLLYDETFEESKESPLSLEESHYFYGIMQGINSVILLISQGGLEEKLHRDINSVEDIMKYFEEKDNE